MAALARLTFATRKRATGVRDGGRKSLRRGRSQEFADHRPYVPGDDLRFLDWHLLGRLDSLWIKLFEEESDRTVQLLVDCSASMEGEKLQAARQIAAALGFVALGGSDRVAVLGVSDRVERYAPPARGRRATHGIFRALEEVHPGGTTDLSRALAGAPRQRGASVAVLFTDFMYPEGAEEPLRRLLAQGWEVHAFHILSPQDVRPALDGELLLVDRESGEEVAVTVDREVLAAYDARLRAWIAGIEGICRRLGVGYVRVLSNADLEALLLRDLRRLGVLA
jgi:uncharacterized protein (DUF58 family)